MTGAGSGDVVIDIEDSFLTAPSTPDPHRLGRNPTVDQSQIENNPTELSQDGEIESVESLTGRFNGRLTVSSYVSATTQGYLFDYLFNANGEFVRGVRPPTARVYEGVNYYDGTVEKEWVGCIPLSYGLSWDGDQLRQTVELGAAGVKRNTSLSFSSPTGPALGSTVPFHGFDLSVDGTSVQDLQQAELSIDNIAQFQTGTQRTPTDVSMAKPTTSLSAEAILQGPGRLEAALGGSAATEVQDYVATRPATIDLEAQSGPVATLNLAGVTPATYDWADVIGESDTTDPVDYQVTGGVSIA